MALARRLGSEHVQKGGNEEVEDDEDGQDNVHDENGGDVPLELRVDLEGGTVDEVPVVKHRNGEEG